MRRVPRARPASALVMALVVAAGLAAGACSGGGDAPPSANGAQGESPVLGAAAGVSADDGRHSTSDPNTRPASPAASGSSGVATGMTNDSAGPAPVPPMFTHPVGTDVADGQRVFRWETFGDEGFWTKVLQLPQGFASRGVTPAQALAAGLTIDIDAVPEDLKALILAQAASAGSASAPTAIPALQDPANTAKLIEANAIVGLVARKGGAPLAGPLNGTLDVDASDVFAGESVGVSCALCHSITDGSTLAMVHGGSIGRRLDGRANNDLQVGKIIALANRSVAFYPSLALDLASNDHRSVSRSGAGAGLLPAAPTEEQVDAYLNDDNLYPVGMFDDQPDGNGAPMHIAPLFRTDLAAPWGSEGSIHMLQNFSNLVYTVMLDPTDLLARGPATNAPTHSGAEVAAFTGPQYLQFEKAGAAGLELIANYKNIIEKQLGIPAYSAGSAGSAGNDGYPYVGRPSSECKPAPAGVENEASIAGLACNQTKLLDLNAYLDSLRAPVGTKGDASAMALGRAVFRRQCTSCHNDDQSKFVPENIVALNATVDLFGNAPPRPALFQGYNGLLVADRPGAPFADLVPAKNSMGIFDDKLIYTEASNYGQPRGFALPLLMDLGRKRAFLHDDEVTAGDPISSLSLLLDSARGPTAPHAFYVSDPDQRSALVAFLQSLDDTPLPP